MYLIPAGWWGHIKWHTPVYTAPLRWCYQDSECFLVRLGQPNPVPASYKYRKTLHTYCLYIVKTLYVFCTHWKHTVDVIQSVSEYEIKFISAMLDIVPLPLMEAIIKMTGNVKCNQWSVYVRISKVNSRWHSLLKIFNFFLKTVKTNNWLKKSCQKIL